MWAVAGSTEFFVEKIFLFRWIIMTLSLDIWNLGKNFIFLVNFGLVTSSHDWRDLIGWYRGSMTHLSCNSSSHFLWEKRPVKRKKQNKKWKISERPKGAKVTWKMNNAFGAPKSGNDTEILEFLKRPRTWVKAALFFTHLVALSTQGINYKLIWNINYSQKDGSWILTVSRCLLIHTLKYRDNI